MTTAVDNNITTAEKNQEGSMNNQYADIMGGC